MVNSSTATWPGARVSGSGFDTERRANGSLESPAEILVRFCGVEAVLVRLSQQWNEAFSDTTEGHEAAIVGTSVLKAEAAVSTSWMHTWCPW